MDSEQAVMTQLRTPKYQRFRKMLTIQSPLNADEVSCRARTERCPSPITLIWVCRTRKYAPLLVPPL